MLPQIKLRLPSLIVLALVLSACNNADATKVGSALHDVSIAVGGLQDAVHAANIATPAVISDGSALAIYQICDRVNKAGLEASSLTRQYSVMPPGVKPKLADLINPILAAVNDSLATGLIPIQDAGTKQKVKTALESIRSGLTVVQTIVGG